MDKFVFISLQIAMGVPLHRIKEIRIMYGEDPWGATPINFDSPPNIPEPRGHVIAARITSENPDEVRTCYWSQTSNSIACFDVMTQLTFSQERKNS